MASDILNIESQNTANEGNTSGSNVISSNAQSLYQKNKENLDSKISSLNSSIDTIKSGLIEAETAFNALSQYGQFSLSSRTRATNAANYLRGVINNAQRFVGQYGEPNVVRGAWVGYGVSEDGYMYNVVINMYSNSTPSASDWIPRFRQVLNGYINALNPQEANVQGLQEFQSALKSVPNVGGTGEPRGGSMKALYDSLPAIINLASTVDSLKTKSQSEGSQAISLTEQLNQGKFTRERAVEALKNKKTSEGITFGSV